MNPILKSRAAPILIVAVLALTLASGCIRLSIAQELGGRLEERALVQQWPTQTITITASGNCQADYGQLAVVLNNPSYQQWQDYKDYGLDVQVSLINPITHQPESTDPRIDEYPADAGDTRLPFSDPNMGSGAYRGVVIGPSSWIHKIKGFSEQMTCQYVYVITPKTDSEPEHNPDPDPQECTLDTFTCPDGTVLTRFPPACEFGECPEDEPQPSEDNTGLLIVIIGLAAAAGVAALAYKKVRK